MSRHLFQVVLAAISSSLSEERVEAEAQRERRMNDNATTGHLTRRELEVLHHVAMGLHDRTIAKALGISERTIDSHLQSIYRKLYCRTRTAAARWYLLNALD